MKTRLCFKYFTFFFFLQTATSNAQTTFSEEAAIEYIKDYYSNLQTGFDSDGYNIVTTNYKATFTDRVFELTYDEYDTNTAEKKETHTVTFNFNDIESIEPMGMENAAIYGDETIYIPLNAKLLFKNATNKYYINIYYEVDDDVTTTEIYKAFKKVLKL